MDNNEITIDLLKLAKAIWKKAWAVLLAALVFGGATYAYQSHNYVPKYTSSATLYTRCEKIAIGEDSQVITQSSISDAKSMVNTCISLLNTRTVREEVIRKTGLNLTVSQLSGMVTAAPMNSTELFTISVTSSDAEEAALIANTLAQILPEKVSMVNTNGFVGLIDSALVPSSPNGNSITKNTVIFAVLGAFLACAVIAVPELAAQIKEQKANNQ